MFGEFRQAGGRYCSYLLLPYCPTKMAKLSQWEVLPDGSPCILGKIGQNSVRYLDLHLDEGIPEAFEGVVTALEEDVERDGVAEEVKEVGGEELQNGSKDL